MWFDCESIRVNSAVVPHRKMYLTVWFIKCLPRSSSFGKALDPKDVSGHIDRHTRIFMDADTDKNRYRATLGFFLYM